MNQYLIWYLALCYPVFGIIILIGLRSFKKDPKTKQIHETLAAFWDSIKKTMAGSIKKPQNFVYLFGILLVLLIAIPIIFPFYLLSKILSLFKKKKKDDTNKHECQGG